MKPDLRRAWPMVSLSGAILLAAGCAMNSAYDVKVDAIAKPPAQTAHALSYKLKSKDPRLGEESLRYQEAADFVKTALSGKGLYEAPSEDKADMIVELEFGMEKPRSKVERMSTPVYAQVGGGVRYESMPVTDSRGNTSFRTVAVYDAPSTELVGYDDMPRLVPVYEKYLKITAHENKPASEGRPPAELWSVSATTEDESKDLRKYLPIMASASIDYIGGDTSNQKNVKVRADGPAVDFVRKGMQNNAAAQAAAAPKG